jgi:hypothetical protein
MSAPKNTPKNTLKERPEEHSKESSKSTQKNTQLMLKGRLNRSNRASRELQVVYKSYEMGYNPPEH